jgi:hypothetical protein
MGVCSWGLIAVTELPSSALEIGIWQVHPLSAYATRMLQPHKIEIKHRIAIVYRLKLSAAEL